MYLEGMCTRSGGVPVVVVVVVAVLEVAVHSEWWCIRSGGVLKVRVYSEHTLAPFGRLYHVCHSIWLAPGFQGAHHPSLHTDAQVLLPMCPAALISPLCRLTTLVPVCQDVQDNRVTICLEWLRSGGSTCPAEKCKDYHLPSHLLGTYAPLVGTEAAVAGALAKPPTDAQPACAAHAAGQACAAGQTGAAAHL